VAYWTIQDRRVANEEKLCALTSVRPRELTLLSDEEAEGEEGEEEDAEVSGEGSGAGGRVDREEDEPVIVISSSSSKSSSIREWKANILLSESVESGNDKQELFFDFFRGLSTTCSDCASSRPHPSSHPHSSSLTVSHHSNMLSTSHHHPP
jgi:hypothetical protein